jgi:hypothetical protein
MATTYELRKALYKTIEDIRSFSIGDGVITAKLFAFDTTSETFGFSTYTTVTINNNEYKFNIEIDGNEKYFINQISYPTSLDAQISFAVNGGAVYIKTGNTFGIAGATLPITKIAARKEIKYGIITNPAIVKDNTPSPSIPSGK